MKIFFHEEERFTLGKADNILEVIFCNFKFGEKAQSYFFLSYACQVKPKYNELLSTLP